MSKIIWEIRREGRPWSKDEVRERYDLAPSKVELIDGKLFWTEEDRLVMLGLLLENVGIDKAISLGNADAWRAAVSNLEV